MGSLREFHVRQRSFDWQYTILMQTRKDGQLDFDAMDVFISAVLAVLQEQGSRAVRVFPPDAQVLVSFADRIASEVVCVLLSMLTCLTSQRSQ